MKTFTQFDLLQWDSGRGFEARRRRRPRTGTLNTHRDEDKKGTIKMAVKGQEKLAEKLEENETSTEQKKGKPTWSASVQSGELNITMMKVCFFSLALSLLLTAVEIIVVFAGGVKGPLMIDIVVYTAYASLSAVGGLGLNTMIVIGADVVRMWRERGME